jgi:hypothetical protein
MERRGKRKETKGEETKEDAKQSASQAEDYSKWEEFAPPWEKFDKSREVQKKPSLKDLSPEELKQSAQHAPKKVWTSIASIVSIVLVIIIHTVHTCCDRIQSCVIIHRVSSGLFATLLDQTDIYQVRHTEATQKYTRDC